MRRTPSFVLPALAILLWISRAVAQPVPTNASGVDDSTAGTARTQETALGWWWNHTTVVPIVFYAPENQLGLGGGLMSAWQQPGAFEDRPSSVTLLGVYTTLNQTIVAGSYELHFANDRHIWWQEARYIDWPDRFYGIGNTGSDADREDFTDRYFQVESEYQHRLWRHFYVGGRHQLRTSNTLDLDDDGVLSTDRRLGVGPLRWSGVGALLLWDDRQGLFWPTGGNLLRADVTLFRRAFGAEFTGELVRLDLRRYQPLWLDHVMVLRLVMHASSGDLPFQLLPMLGGGLLFRGWFLGRLRDRVMLAHELEYRAPLSPRWAVVGFGSIGRVAPRLSALSLSGLKPTGGLGVRFAVREQDRANFRLDIAYGDDLAVYFQFREAF